MQRPDASAISLDDAGNAEKHDALAGGEMAAGSGNAARNPWGVWSNMSNMSRKTRKIVMLVCALVLIALVVGLAVPLSLAKRPGISSGDSASTSTGSDAPAEPGSSNLSGDTGSGSPSSSSTPTRISPWPQLRTSGSVTVNIGTDSVGRTLSPGKRISTSDNQFLS